MLTEKLIESRDKGERKLLNCVDKHERGEQIITEQRVTLDSNMLIPSLFDG